MSTIELQGITKVFGKTTALDDLHVTVQDKEFFILFGPAGAGKTTTLKTVAGIEFPTTGRVLFDGQIVNRVDPTDRDVAMVFENYALYPHMTVFDNIASPMRSPLHRKDEAYIRKEVGRVALLMGIEKFLERFPAQLSNGQRQRTALGRCLVRSPRVFLMDEPLAHLDAKLRHLMRTELKAMQAEFDTTTIYVTHDYMEALSLGDRVAIMNNGRIEQIGSGADIYHRPANEFVARLVGEPEINIVDADLVRSGDELCASICSGTGRYPLPAGVANELEAHGDKRVRLGIRGVNIGYSLAGGGGVAGTVFNLEPIGNKSILTVACGGERFQIVAPNDLQAALDSPVSITLDTGNMLFFDASSGKLITRTVTAKRA